MSKVSPASGPNIEQKRFGTFVIVWPGDAICFAKIAGISRANNYAVEVDPNGDYLIVGITDADKFILALISELKAFEISNTRILLSATATPSLAAFKDVVMLATLADRVNSRWLVSLLDDRRYVSYAQPIVSADGDWDTIAHEFLFRGLSEEGGLIPPDTLFGAAKDPKILYNLDRAARIHAVSTAARMKRNDEVFINFIPGSVYDPEICLQTTLAAAQNCGIANDRIVIEIVESHQVDDIEGLRGIVKYYRDNGLRVALDDFGTGFNNLDMYIALEPDFVKLDKSLTSNLTDTDPRLGMVKGIVRTAHSSGIKVVAEGIETAMNARVVSDCGVDRMQGYFFGRPSPVN